VYFTHEERKIVDEAARIERRSTSSFVVNAALEAADRLSVHKRQKNQ
jgi:uncharacterized protein (DUF1778 family)